ncbi:hypothetical protein Tco_1575878 [Tanacetum coccineum]
MAPRVSSSNLEILLFLERRFINAESKTRSQIFCVKYNLVAQSGRAGRRSDGVSHRGPTPKKVSMMYNALAAIIPCEGSHGRKQMRSYQKVLNGDRLYYSRAATHSDLFVTVAIESVVSNGRHVSQALYCVARPTN